jgi:uncharacterized repeat protein (TIGR03803 family)
MKSGSNAPAGNVLRILLAVPRRSGTIPAGGGKRTNKQNGLMKMTRVFLFVVNFLALWMIASSSQGGVVLTTLVSFDGTNGSCGGGGSTAGGLVQGSDGIFYGTITFGGTGYDGSVQSGCGTVFKMTPNGTLTTLAWFNGTNGAYPVYTLVEGTDGSFYGATWCGGTGYNGSLPSGYGTVFKITRDGQLTTLASFNGTNGSGPNGGMVRARDGNFYGTTSWGGTGYDGSIWRGHGTVFQLTTNGVLSTLVAFDGTNGNGPFAELLQANDGNFYGTTYAGGASDQGTVFKMTPEGTVTTLHSFNLGVDGAYPEAGLVQGADGDLYGTTEYGGGDVGSVFKITTNGAFTTLAHFSMGEGGALPRAALVQAADGNFYGTTSVEGAYGNGTAFRMSPDGTITTLISFPFTNGNPTAALVQGRDGNLYGRTSQGSLYGYGTIFRLCVPMPPVFRTITRSNDTVSLAWSAVAGQTYQLQYKSDPCSTNWNNLGSAAVATNGAVSASDTVGSIPQRYYRAVLLP